MGSVGREEELFGGDVEGGGWGTHAMHDRSRMTIWR